MRIRNAAIKKLGKSPGELYANLASFMGEMADRAAQKEEWEDVQEFKQQQELLSRTSDQLSDRQETKGKSGKSSRPKKTTGKAAG